MRIFALLFILIFKAHAQVEDFGRDGLFGSVDILDPIEGFLGNSWACNKATKEERDRLDGCIQHYKVFNPADQANYDSIVEELAFMETARRSHQLSICQVKLHDSLANPEVKGLLFENAYQEFKHIRDNALRAINYQDEKQKDVNAVKSGMSFYEDRMSGTLLVQQERLDKAQTALKFAKDDLNNLVSRIPLGNRGEMKDKLIELFRKNPNADFNTFRNIYSGVVANLNKEAHQAKTFFDKLITSRDSAGVIYKVDENLKKSLVKSGQLENTLSALGLRDEFAGGLYCRAVSRYREGPMNLLIAEFPAYFLGMYGLGRLAARAGVAVIRGASAASRTGAAITQWSSKAAMLGLEAYNLARTVDIGKQICIPQEFLSGDLDEGCTGETEVSGIYQEAWSAQCLTYAGAQLVPLAFKGGIKIWSRTHAEVPVTPADSLAEKGITVSNYRNFFNKANPVSITDPERLYLFKQYSGINELTRIDEAELLALHRIGKGYGHYTKAELRAKTDGILKILERHNIKGKQAKQIADLSLRQGILGNTFNAHAAITADLYQGEIVSVKPFSANNNMNSIYLVKIKGKDPYTGEIRMREAIFKPRVWGDGDGFNRTTMEYAAYHINRLLKMDYVPPTAYRRGLNIEINGHRYTEGAFLYKVPEYSPLADMPGGVFKNRNEAVISDNRVLNVLMNNSDGHAHNLGTGRSWVNGSSTPTFLDFGASLRKGTKVAMDDYKAYGNSEAVTSIRRQTLNSLKGLKSSDFDDLVSANFMTREEVGEMLQRRDGIVEYFRRPGMKILDE